MKLLTLGVLLACLVLAAHGKKSAKKVARKSAKKDNDVLPLKILDDKGSKKESSKKDLEDQLKSSGVIRIPQIYLKGYKPKKAKKSQKSRKGNGKSKIRKSLLCPEWSTDKLCKELIRKKQFKAVKRLSKQLMKPDENTVIFAEGRAKVGKDHVKIKVHCFKDRLYSKKFKKYKKSFKDLVFKMTLLKEFSEDKCEPVRWTSLVQHKKFKNFGIITGHSVWVNMGCDATFNICVEKKKWQTKKWTKKKAHAVMAVFKAPWFCFINPSKGPTGQSRLLKWYFSRAMKCCLSFVFGGKPGEGNENNFKTREDCERVCHPRKPHFKPSKIAKKTLKCFKHERRINSLFFRTVRKFYKGCLIRVVKLLTEYSRKRCKKGDTWKFYKNELQVSGNCRATFKICYVPGFMATCFSWHYKRRLCRFAKTIRKVYIHRQFSKAKCKIGSNVKIVDDYTMQVTDGCRANFEIETFG